MSYLDEVCNYIVCGRNDSAELVAPYNARLNPKGALPLDSNMIICNQALSKPVQCCLVSSKIKWYNAPVVTPPNAFAMHVTEFRLIVIMMTASYIRRCPWTAFACAQVE